MTKSFHVCTDCKLDSIELDRAFKKLLIEREKLRKDVVSSS